MSLIKTTSYAPDIYKNLNGFLLVYKSHNTKTRFLIDEIRERLSDSLNELEPRPLSTRLEIVGGFNEEKRLIHLPNLADHPLIVGPRYLPEEIYIKSAWPHLGYRTSGLSVLTLGRTAGRYNWRLRTARLPSIYHVDGEFGYKTHNYFQDGNIVDKNNYHKIRTGRLDSVLTKIESSQRDRLFDSSRVSIHTQEAYELAKSWPSRPAKMAIWPVIYRIRCLHLKLPHFKLEITVTNEDEQFLGQLVNDIGIMLRSSAFTSSIRRVKYGPFTIDDCLTDKEWDIQSVVDNLKKNQERLPEIDNLLRNCRRPSLIRTEYKPKEFEYAGIMSDR